MAQRRAYRNLHSWRWIAVLLIVSVFVFSASGEVAKDSLSSLSIEDIEEKLQECPLLQDLSAQKRAENTKSQSTLIAKAQALLFPETFSPAVNALLATAYISGPPNFILYFVPADIDPASLSMMVAFAVGGILGDTFFHLLPEIFVGEENPNAVEVKIVDSRRNLLKGVGIFVGLLTFVAMDKALRIGLGGGAHDHGLGKKDDHAHGLSDDDATSTAVDTPKKAKSRKKQLKGSNEKAITPASTASTSLKLSSILSLIADFTHNSTDGIALASSFYLSRNLGFTTFIAIFFHELPHEIGDAAMLMKGGFSKNGAMLAQFFTAVGAFLGCFIGIAVQHFSGSTGEAAGAVGSGILGTGLGWGDMLLPFTAGTFLFVGTCGVIPEMLERRDGETKAEETRRTFGEFFCMILGAGIMVAISL